MRVFIFIFLYFGTVTLVTAQEDPSLRTPIFGRGDRSERRCRFRRATGVCKRRSECRQPTERVCRFSIRDPVVCCLDRPEDEESRPSAVLTPGTPAPRPRPTTSRPSAISPQESPSPRPRPSTRRPDPKPTKPPQATKRPSPKPENTQREPDLTFPGCGSRSPSVPDTSARSSPSDINSASSRNSGTGRSRGGRFGGLFSRRGKRGLPLSYDVENELDGLVVKRRYKRQRDPVIVGGVTAKPNSWPWMTAIFKKSATGSSSRYLCGASLISTLYVISAAHCFDSERGNIDPLKFLARVGAHNTKDGTEYPVVSVKVHPDYHQRQYYNDISILQLGKQVTLTKKVYPVCMPQPSILSRIITHQDVTVTGWGDTTFGGVPSKVLHEVSFPIVPLRECNASYTKVAISTFPRGITDNFICAGVEEGGKDACQGDSGGPLVMNTVEDKWVQVGIVSFGYGCARPGFPGVYTRVQKYRQWIYENSDLGRK